MYTDDIVKLSLSKVINQAGINHNSLLFLSGDDQAVISKVQGGLQLALIVYY